MGNIWHQGTEKPKPYSHCLIRLRNMYQVFDFTTYWFDLGYPTDVQDERAYHSEVLKCTSHDGK